MTPLEEAQSLNTNPLPLTDLDKLLPSQIAAIDDEIARLEANISGLSMQRQELLEKAISNNVLEDADHLIRHIVKEVRSLNLNKFRTLFPDEYNQIIELQRKQAVEKAESTIPIVTAERFIAKSVLSTKPVFDITKRESWQVVRK